MARSQRMIMGLLVSVVIFSANVAGAQTTSPEALSAAKDLVETMHLSDQLRTILPTIMKNMKASVVQGRAEVDMQYEAVAPKIIDSFRARVSELTDAIAIIYARNFSTEELQALVVFYKTPIGQKFLQKVPSLTQETMVVGSKFGKDIGGEVQQRIKEELRKKGIDL